MDKYLSDKIKILSFCSILLVVFLHAFNLDGGLPGTILFFKSPVWVVEDVISYGFTRIAVPIFFLLSGYLFFLNTTGKSGEFTAKIIKRARTLLVPFLLWSLFGIAFYFTLQSIPQIAVFFTKGRVADFSVQKWLLTIFVQPIPYQLWFIRDLMVLVLLAPLWYFMLKNFGKPLLLIILVCWFVYAGALRNSLEALLFFLVGGYISLQNPQLMMRTYKNSVFYLMAFWVILVGFKSALLYFDCNPLLTQIVLKLSILVGMIAFWGIYDVFCSRDSSKKGVLKISGFTFFIFAAHEPMLTIFKKVLFVVLNQTPMSHLEIFILAPLLAIISCLLLAMILKKYITAGYGLITGGR